MEGNTPVRPQKIRTGCIFQQLVQPVFFLFFFSFSCLLFFALLPGVICVTYYDWSAAHSSTNCCNCLRKSCHLSSWLGVHGHREWTV